MLAIGSVSFTAAMVLGYDLVANTATISMPSMLLKFGDVGPTGPYLPSLWTSLWTSMSSLAQAISAILAGAVADRYGRKWTAVGAATLTLVGTAVQFTCQTREWLLGGKIIAGFGIGATYAIGIAYSSEVSGFLATGIFS
jgi:MFS family permease